MLSKMKHAVATLGTISKCTQETIGKIISGLF
jgi:hypothetical protein